MPCGEGMVNLLARERLIVCYSATAIRPTCIDRQGGAPGGIVFGLLIRSVC